MGEGRQKEDRGPWTFWYSQPVLSSEGEDFEEEEERKKPRDVDDVRRTVVREDSRERVRERTESRVLLLLLLLLLLLTLTLPLTPL